ncbi:MAG TPA: autotransporter domain-containing protein [Bdellovibrionales bacterium]|nr:autotransporter domain-containing protein [Bdellovibrionales bacterium]
MKFVLVAIVILGTFTAQAQTAKKQKSTETQEVSQPVEAPKADSTPTSASADSALAFYRPSEFNRNGKTIQLNVILFGVGPSITSTSGLQAGFFINRNMMLLLEGTTGRLESSIRASSLDSSLDLRSTSFGLHFKHYLGNSFYYRIGGDYRHIEYENKFSWDDVGDKEKFKGRSFVANLQIGNQWQWDNFTLGCDWIGYVAPLSSSIYDEKFEGDTSAYDIRNAREDQDILVKNSHITVLRFYLGASF